MTATVRSFVVGGLFVLFGSACGDTTTNNDHSETPDTSSTATGSGGSATSGTTSTATTSATNGTGGTTSNFCPSFEPAQGSSCASEGQVCAFENCEAPDYRDHHTLTCVDGAWTLTVALACPPVDCPITPPGVGLACDVSVTPGPCSAVDACGEAREAVCVNGLWLTTDDEDNGAERPWTSATSGGAGTGGDPAPPLCPAYPPYYLEPCCPSRVPPSCDYTEPGTTGAAGASFIVLPDTTSSGAGAAPPPTLNCAVCTDQMVWDSCPQE